MRPLTFLLLACLAFSTALLPGCSREEKTGGAEARLDPRDLSEVLPISEQIQVTPVEGDPVGAVSAMMRWKDQLVIVDGIQRNLKVLDPRGRVVRTVGRAGFGPGEYQMPFAATEWRGDTVAILDRERMQVALLDSDLEFVRSIMLPGVRATGVHWLARENAVLVPMERTAEGERISIHTLHLFTPTGELVRSAQPLLEFQPGEGTFRRLHAAVVGGTVVSVVAARGELQLTDLRTGSVRLDSLPAEVYQAPAWPAKTWASIHELEEWKKGQMFSSNVFAVDEAHYLVELSSYDAEREQFEARYVLRSLGGETLAVTRPGLERVYGISDGAVFTAHMDEAGELIVSIRDVPAGRLGVRGRTAQRRP